MGCRSRAGHTACMLARQQTSPFPCIPHTTLQHHQHATMSARRRHQQQSHNQPKDVFAVMLGWATDTHTGGPSQAKTTRVQSTQHPFKHDTSPTTVLQTGDLLPTSFWYCGYDGNNRTQTARMAKLALQLHADRGGKAHTPQALCPAARLSSISTEQSSADADGACMCLA